MVVLDAPVSLATSRRLNLLSREYSKIFRSCLIVILTRAIVLLLYCMFVQECSDFSRIVLTVNYSGAMAKTVRLFPESVSALLRNDCPFSNRIGVRIGPDSALMLQKWDKQSNGSSRTAKFSRKKFERDD